MIKKASVLITDYSDLQFKFSYLDKPVVYYFPHGLPVQQEYKNEGLAKNSFGKLFFEHDTLIAHLISEMGKDFPQSEHYSRMNKEFFKFHDNHNCRRILRSVKSSFLGSIFKNEE